MGATAPVRPRSGALRRRNRRQLAQHLRPDSTAHASQRATSRARGACRSGRSGRVRHGRLSTDAAARHRPRVQTHVRRRQRNARFLLPGKHDHASPMHDCPFDAHCFRMGTAIENRCARPD